MKNDFFGFSKVKRLQYTGEVENLQAIDVKFSQDLTHQNSLKSVNFRESYLKNKKVFGTQCTQSDKASRWTCFGVRVPRTLDYPTINLNPC